MSSQKINNKNPKPLKSPFIRDEDTFIHAHKTFADVQVESTPNTDPGKHYNNNTLRVKVSKWDYDVGYMDIKMEPYLVGAICNVGGGAREHILKKVMRGADKGHTENDVYREIICCAEAGIKLNNLLEKGKLCTPNT